ncbi:MAG: hypothetical protein IPG04_08335 [Polyangiaceae bacterium]|nr:hypothetical protein [Polyangiaceae bacterium]
MSDTNDTVARKTIRISLPVSAYAILSYRAALAAVSVTEYVGMTVKIDALPKVGEPGYQAEVADDILG